MSGLFSRVAPRRAHRQRLHTVVVGCASLVACTLYDQALLDDARSAGGGGGAPHGSGASDPGASGGTEAAPVGGDGSGAMGGEADGAGGTPVAGSTGRAGNAGSAGSAGNGGAGGSSGRAGAAGAGAHEAGQGGSGEAGAGGEAGCDGVPGCDCGPTAESCAELTAAIVHRYDFEGDDTGVTDRAGSLDGEVIGTTLAGDGTLVLAGGSALEAEVLEHVASQARPGRVVTRRSSSVRLGADGPPWQRSSIREPLPARRAPRFGSHRLPAPARARARALGSARRCREPVT